MERRAAILSFALALASQRGLAGPLDELVMPGPVSAAHAKLEKECANCHATLEPSRQRALCLDCHKEVAADVSAKRGFHGRAPQVRAAQCSDCHSEHAGRDADIVGLVRESFDHRVTDFALLGAHQTVSCAGCHAAEKPFWEAPHDCVACHREDDRHRGAMGTKCADCHEPVRWQKARFDHSKTRFPLTDAHAKAQCAQCHPGERYKQTPRDCVGCHKIDDFHRGSFGTDCASCHTTKGWEKRSFDHDRDTKFPLTGSHERVECTGCHTSGVTGPKPKSDCLSCHRGDDDHRGRNGALCADCHSTATWKPARFDHAKTKFPLRGEHAQVPCAACHTQNVHTQKLRTDCVSCHRGADPHAGKQGEQCERCHREVGWREDVRFDHDLARFPLLGLHASVACEECHASRVYVDAEQHCVACHAARDVHEKRLGPACQSCHNPAGWTAWRFDHATQTSFPLHGAHEKTACTACHVTPSDGKIELRQDCGACHGKDDAHDGRFGRDCQRCHSETSWRDVNIR